ncbi:MAG: hypothetical protein QXH24_05840 [Candidatus Bathyarchaeia archaeon]
MRKSIRIWAQTVILMLLGSLWLVRGFINNNFAITIIGLSLVLGAASFTLTDYAMSNSRVKRYLK